MYIIEHTSAFSGTERYFTQRITNKSIWVTLAPPVLQKRFFTHEKIDSKLSLLKSKCKIIPVAKVPNWARQDKSWYQFWK